MSRLRLAPKPTEAKPITSFKAALRARAALIESTNRDPQYQALRLRGLAGLIRASEDGLGEVGNINEVLFFLASAVDEVAEALSPDVS